MSPTWDYTWPKGQYKYKRNSYMSKGKITARKSFVTKDKETPPTKSGKT
jgi:hypothetical protein